ncbi:MAG: sigma-70 family RNA polymerase sigma factor [Bacteroidales bacterium]
MHNQTEAYYLERIIQGDKESFTPIVEKYKDMVYTLCIRMLRSEEDAREAAQDVFMKAYRSVESFRGKSKFSTWIYRITYNHCISMLRKQVKMIDLVDELPEFRIDEETMDAMQEIRDGERKRYLQKAMETLPETDSLVVTLFYYEELSLEEIEEITGLSGSNIRVKLHRARQKLYIELSKLLKTEIQSIL